MSWTELVGNVLCLDFANSVNRRPDPERDWLAEPDGLGRWAVHAGVDAARRRTGPDDAALLADARALRDAVHRTFSAVASGKDPAAADLAVIAEQYAAGVAAARLTGGGSASYTMVWPRQPGHRQVLWAVADSAVELLRHGPLDRVGECPSCTWLFLDTSRNGRRRWCSMATCGNQSKSARHYARTSRG